MRDWKYSCLPIFWLACFILLLFHLYLYILSYSCCFFVMFVYLRLIGQIEREPISRYLITLPHHTHRFHSKFFGTGFFFFFCLDEREVSASLNQDISPDSTELFQVPKHLFSCLVLKKNLHIIYVITCIRKKKKRLFFLGVSLACLAQFFGLMWIWWSLNHQNVSLFTVWLFFQAPLPLSPCTTTQCTSTISPQ